jgi:hypothetical protein
MHFRLLFLAAVLVATGANAREHGSGNQRAIDRLLLADSCETFAEAAEQVRLELRPGGRYDIIDDRDKWRIEWRLVQMANLFRVSRTAEAMSRDQKTQLLALQSQIGDLLKHNDASRFFCKEQGMSGSNMPATICRTLGGVLLWPPGPL